MQATAQRVIPKIPPLPDLETCRQRRFKLDLLTRTQAGFRARIYKRCKEDFKFWAENYAFAYDEHTDGDMKILPLAFYEFQEEMALDMVANIFAVLQDPIKKWNAGGDKARKMTATFTSLLVLQWFAQYHGVSSIITSKTEEDVDILDNMNTPFERLRWQIRLQYQSAPWLFPPDFNPESKTCSKVKLLNFRNGGQISGMAPTGKAMRQGRALIWFGDEFAFVDGDDKVWEASAGTVRVRLIFSTPNGPYCKFSRLVFKKDGEQFKVYELDWWKNPTYAQGLYKKPDGTLSSPVMDEIIATNSRQVVAREYLRDHNESIGGRVFSNAWRGDECCVPGLGPDRYTKNIYRCWDPGLTYGVTWAQKDSAGRLRFLRELVLEDKKLSKGHMLLKAVAERAIKITEQEYEDFEIIDIGDPYGGKKQVATQEETEYELLYKLFKIRVQSAFMRVISTHERKTRRIELLADLMTRDVAVEDDDGSITYTPGLLVNPDLCPIAVDAFLTGYRYKVLDNGEVTEEVIDAHPYTEVVDCIGMTAIKIFEEEKRGDGPVRIAKRGKTQWRPTKGRMRRHG